MCLVLQNNFKHLYMWFKKHWNYFLWFATNNVVSTYSCSSLQMWSWCFCFCFMSCTVQVMLIAFCYFPFCLNKFCNRIHIPLFHFGQFLVIWHLNFPHLFVYMFTVLNDNLWSLKLPLFCMWTNNISLFVIPVILHFLEIWYRVQTRLEFFFNLCN